MTKVIIGEVKARLSSPLDPHKCLCSTCSSASSNHLSLLTNFQYFYWNYLLTAVQPAL